MAIQDKGVVTGESHAARVLLPDLLGAALKLTLLFRSSSAGLKDTSIDREVTECLAG